MALSIEVGKLYEVTNVEHCKEFNFPFRIRIIDKFKHASRKVWIFIGHDKSRYYEDGRFYNGGLKCPYNLKYEVVEKKSAATHEPRQ